MNPDERDFLNLRRLPALLTPQRVAWLLGVLEHEVPIISSARLLKPVGDPEQHDKKLYSTAEVLSVGQDEGKLSKIRKSAKSYWAKKNKSRRHSNTGRQHSEPNPLFPSNRSCSDQPGEHELDCSNSRKAKGRPLDRLTKSDAAGERIAE